jgi:hypothetical protein
MKKIALVAVLVASGALGAEKLYAVITGAGQQSVPVGGGQKYRLQCRPTATNGGIVRFRTSQVDGGVSLTTDPEIAFVGADGTRLDPYPIHIPASDTRLNLAATDAGTLDCSLFRMVP